MLLLISWYTNTMSAQDLQRVANELRGDVLKMVHKAGAGHVAGPMSSSELLAVLYIGGVLRYKVDESWSEERDRFVLSCGHYCPVLYAALSRSGFFDKSRLDSFMKVGGLPGHPEYRCAPGVEATTGSLGQGVSFAVGQAMAIKLKYGERARVDTPRVYCLLSDGEMQEGQVWEAFNFAVRRQLDNLIFIVDRNRVQIENYVSQIVSYGEVVGKLESFGLYTLETDGNDVEKVRKVLDKAKEAQGGPVAIVLNTVAGKGVSFMENKPEWHDRVPTAEELEMALEELK